MSDENHVFDSLPAYAIGSLDEGEAQVVAEHVAGCVLCRQELDTFQQVADQLALMAPEASPSAEVKRRLVAQLQGPGMKRPVMERRRFPLRLLPIGAILSMLVIVALAVSNFLLWQRLDHLEVLSGAHGMRAIALQSSTVAPKASAFIVIGADGGNGVLVVDQMPVLDAEHQYQLWLRRDGQDTSGAVFSVDEEGYRGVRVEAPDSLLVYAAVRVTIEPAGGSPSPTGEQVLGGSLFNP